MAGDAEFSPTRLLIRLAKAEVDFVVIGGVAVVVQASPRFTKDLDITYDTREENLIRLGSVLQSIGTKLRGIEEDVPFVPDERTLARTQLLTLTTDLGALDLLVGPTGCPPYPRLRDAADVVKLNGVEVKIAAIEDMLAMKRAAGRPQDLVDIESLEIAARRHGTRRKRR